MKVDILLYNRAAGYIIYWSDGVIIMQDKRRPLSPHIQIYKPQISSVLSITHRFVTIILMLFYIVFASWLVSWSVNKDFFEQIIDVYHNVGGRILFTIFIYSYVYFFCNSIRHLCWDFGMGYSIPVIDRGGIAVVLTTLLLGSVLVCYLL